MPVLANPGNRGKAITLTFDQFRYGWANAVSEDEARELYDAFHVAAPGAPLVRPSLAQRRISLLRFGLASRARLSWSGSSFSER